VKKWPGASCDRSEKVTADKRPAAGRCVGNDNIVVTIPSHKHQGGITGGSQGMDVGFAGGDAVGRWHDRGALGAAMSVSKLAQFPVEWGGKRATRPIKPQALPESKPGACGSFEPGLAIRSGRKVPGRRRGTPFHAILRLTPSKTIPFGVWGDLKAGGDAGGAIRVAAGAGRQDAGRTCAAPRVENLWIRRSVTRRRFDVGGFVKGGAKPVARLGPGEYSGFT